MGDLRFRWQLGRSGKANELRERLLRPTRWTSSRFPPQPAGAGRQPPSRLNPQTAPVMGTSARGDALLLGSVATAEDSMNNSDHITHLETWTAFPRNTPFVVKGHLGIYRYRYHFQPEVGEARVALYGGKAPAHRVDADVLDLTVVSDTELAMIRHASSRGEVTLDNTKIVTLLAWDVTRPKAKITMASGAILTVNKDRLQLPQEGKPPQ